LAIVERILDEHGGGLELHDSPEVARGGRGAWLRMRFAIDSGSSDAEPTPDAPPVAAVEA
jgi:two-component system nitrogen regulation sensor histidine kinase NtrY